MQYALAVLAGAAVAAAAHEPWGYGQPAYNSSAAPAATQYHSSAAPAYTTAVVSSYETYCPEATQVTYGGQTYTVTSATTLTITNCPCTVTMPVYSSSSAPAAPYYPGHSSAPVAPAPPKYTMPAGHANATAPAGTAPGYKTTTAAAKPPAYTGAADKVSFGVAGLLAAAGLVAAL